MDLVLFLLVLFLLVLSLLVLSLLVLSLLVLGRRGDGGGGGGRVWGSFFMKTRDAGVAFGKKSVIEPWFWFGADELVLIG